MTRKFDMASLDLDLEDVPAQQDSGEEDDDGGYYPMLISAE